MLVAALAAPVLGAPRAVDRAPLQAASDTTSKAPRIAHSIAGHARGFPDPVQAARLLSLVRDLEGSSRGDVYKPIYGARGATVYIYCSI